MCKYYLNKSRKYKKLMTRNKDGIFVNDDHRFVGTDETDYTIYKEIQNINSLDELQLVSKMITNRRNELAKENKHSLIVGQEVEIAGSGKIQFGKITKINRTRAVVECFHKEIEKTVMYTVPFSMIRAKREV